MMQIISLVGAFLAGMVLGAVMMPSLPQAPDRSLDMYAPRDPFPTGHATDSPEVRYIKAECLPRTGKKPCWFVKDGSDALWLVTMHK